MLTRFDKSFGDTLIITIGTTLLITPFMLYAIEINHNLAKVIMSTILILNPIITFLYCYYYLYKKGDDE